MNDLLLDCREHVYYILSNEKVNSRGVELAPSGYQSTALSILDYRPNGPTGIAGEFYPI